MTFGMDANFAAGKDPAEIFDGQLFGIPYNPRLGFEPMLGYDTGFMINCDDHQAFYAATKERYLRRLAPQLEQIRRGIAEHVKVGPERVVLGGDRGSAIEDMFPAGIIVQLPNLAQSYSFNPHTDSQDIGDMLERRLPGCDRPRMVGFTLMLQMPSGGVGLWWWHYPKPGMRGDPWQFADEHEVGHFMSVHGELMHSIAPWENRFGWLDKPRFTMQMFAKRCSGVSDVFH